MEEDRRIQLDGADDDDAEVFSSDDDSWEMDEEVRERYEAIENSGFEEIVRGLARNDPEVRTVYMHRRNRDAVLRLGEAATGNTYVKWANLDLNSLRDAAELVPLLRFLERSPSLEIVHLNLEDADPAVVRRFFRSTSNNSQRVHEVHLHDLGSVHLEAFESLVGSSNLKRLALHGCAMADPSADERLASTVHNSSALQSLTVQLENTLSSQQAPRHTPPFFGLVLGRLPEQLEHLSLLNYYTRHFSATDALHQLQRLPPMLVHLELSHFRFQGGHSFRPICDGLRSSTAARKLTLYHCSLDEEATRLFEGMLLPTGEGSAITSFALDVGNEFAKPFHQIVRNVFSSCTVPTDGAQLEEIDVLDWNEWQDSPEWEEAFQLLGTNARNVMLRVLSVSMVDADSFQAIIDCVPQLVHLKELCIRNMAEDTAELKSDFLLALRKNGSLESVVAYFAKMGDRDGSPFFTEEELRTVIRYCCRNKQLPAMMKKPCVDDKDGQDDEDRTCFALYPRLFHQALQCPGTGQGAVFEGIRALSSVIGDFGGDRKRPANSDAMAGEQDQKRGRLGDLADS